MKTLMISESDMSGGAAIAALRLHKRLIAKGIHSRLLVQNKMTIDQSIIGPTSNFTKGLANIKTSLDHLPKLFYRDWDKTVFHLQWTPDFLRNKIDKLAMDIIHLQWICRGFVNIRTLSRVKKPMIWTFHDMWPITGGCHYADDCNGFQKACGNCPQLGSKVEKDISWITLRRKEKYWKHINLTIVTPSKWLKNCVQQSKLFSDHPIEVITNGVDLVQFQPLDRQFARTKLGLRLDKKLILFGAMDATADKRKGFQFLLDALRKFSYAEACHQVELVILGSSKPINPPEFGLKATFIGRLFDDISLSIVYAACDVFIAPSLEDNLPNTIMEALACGTPCVGFDVGGIPEMIDHQKNGYVAKCLDTEDLYRGISWVLENKQRWNMLSAESRKKAERLYDISVIANKYIELYQSILYRNRV